MNYFPSFHLQVPPASRIRCSLISLVCGSPTPPFFSYQSNLFHTFILLAFPPSALFRHLPFSFPIFYFASFPLVSITFFLPYFLPRTHTSFLPSFQPSSSSSSMESIQWLLTRFPLTPPHLVRQVMTAVPLEGKISPPRSHANASLQLPFPPLLNPFPPSPSSLLIPIFSHNILSKFLSFILHICLFPFTFNYKLFSRLNFNFASLHPFISISRFRVIFLAGFLPSVTSPSLHVHFQFFFKFIFPHL